MKRKPNGSAEKAREAKGRFGRQVYVSGARPYKRSSDAMSPRTASMKDMYAGAKLHRRKLAGRG